MAEYVLKPIVVGAFAVNCWLYPLDDASGGPSRPCIVIDPGASADIIITRMDKLNLYLRYILLTHGHFDHIAALPALAAHAAGTWGPSAEIAIHRADAPYLGPGADRIHRESLNALGISFVDEAWESLPPAGRLLSDGELLGPFRVLHLPGHTPGSVGFYDEKAGVLFSGDTLFHHGVGRTDLPGGDSRALEASLGKLSALPGDTAFFPGHGPSGILGREGSFGRYL
ncbi:MAG: MBL fold metallo-hydrolase [Treponema sp.]|jgi:glyoxylase-like metal-dependent hydrolase (beta-lactamase superfamily II)|nr:MBL fold metallo-hydrolase [Treponema sp.]